MMVKPVCPKCGSDLDTKGEVFWCTKCIGWMAPNDVKFKVRHKPCGHWNPKEFHFCESCGQQLDDDYIVVAEQGRIRVLSSRIREEKKKFIIKEEMEEYRKKDRVTKKDEGNIKPPLSKERQYYAAIIGIMVGFGIIIAGFTNLTYMFPMGNFVGILIGMAIVLLSIVKIIDILSSNVEIKKTDALPTSPTEALPSTITSKQNKYRSQYNCRTCGHLFWRDEYPELKGSQCQKCGASDLMRVATLEYIEPPENIRITEQEEPSPASHLTTKYKSHFNCKACGRSFWVSEHRLKVPYCLNCGAPDPIHIETIELT